MGTDLSDYYTGKNIVLTGASSGLGKAVVQALAPFGCHFCLLSRRTEPMEELRAELEETPSSYFIRSCDVRNKDEVESKIQEFIKISGPVDIAWVNSGVGDDTSFRKWNWDTVKWIMDTNFDGALHTAIPCMKSMNENQSGTVVMISSAAGMRGLPFRSIYSISKIAVTSFMEAMAVELPHIQFTTILPGFVDTPINQGNPARFWVMTPERAAELMIKAVAKRKRFYLYPFKMFILYHLIRMMPYWLYFQLNKKFNHLAKPKG